MKRVRHQHSTAVFVALEQDGAVCLLRRSGTGWMDGHLSLPAGALEAGETIRDAAIREAREEIGVEIDASHLRHGHVLHSFTDGADWLGHFFITTRWNGAPRICEPEKHSEIRWAGLAQLPHGLIPYVHQALLGIARGEAYSEYGWRDP